MANYNESHTPHFFLLSIFFVLLPFSTSLQQSTTTILSLSEFQALLAFKHEADPRGVVLRSWNGTRTGACSGGWTGVKCVNGHVIALQLPFKGLSGRIAPQIGLLRGLRKLSLHDNYLTGVIPSSIGLLPNLRGLHLFSNRLSGLIPVSIGKNPNLQNVDLSNNLLVGSIPIGLGNSSDRLYRLNLSYNSLSGSIPNGVYHSSSLTFLALQHNNFSGSISDQTLKASKNGNSSLRVLTLDYNHFSGEIPNSLTNFSNLKVLSLSHNLLSGQIPAKLGSLINLQTLDLSKNNFTGEIPASLSSILNLTSFNVSYNSLTGEVPSALSEKFKSSSFAGNLQLCGYTSSSPCPISPTPETSPSSSPPAEEANNRKLSIKEIILILVGSILLLLLLLCCVLLCCLIRKRHRSKERTNGATQKDIVTEAAGPAGGTGDGGKLVLFDGPFVFSADDLLCATAEIMGKSAYGTVYKATLEDGNQVAVKRLREKLAKNPKEFEVEVNALGKIRHPNLLPLRAYYLGPKGEKLLVFDYLSNGSLSSFLHGHGPEVTINWPTRMKIAMGVARGLHHLHAAESLPHGSLTASEVYLDENNEAKISDYGVSRLMTESANTNVISTAASTGYRAPEMQRIKKATAKADIYSLGVIMLELLTGKPPGEQIDGADLPQWVASTVKEEWTNEVFDVELQRESSINGDEMLNTLKLALHLVDPSPEARPEIQEVLQQLEEINPKLAAEAIASVDVEEKRMMQD